MFCWFFRAKDFATAFQIADNITKLTFNLEQWQTIILGYKNVFLPIVIGVIWHFIPVKTLAWNAKTFSTFAIGCKKLFY